MSRRFGLPATTVDRTRTAPATTIISKCYGAPRSSNYLWSSRVARIQILRTLGRSLPSFSVRSPKQHLRAIRSDLARFGPSGSLLAVSDLAGWNCSAGWVVSRLSIAHTQELSDLLAARMIACLAAAARCSGSVRSVLLSFLSNETTAIESVTARLH